MKVLAENHTIKTKYADLLKEVGEQVYQVCKSDSISLSAAWIDVTEQTYNDAGLYPEYGRRILYTSNQVAVAVLKATKLLEEEIERLKTVPMKYRRMAFNAQLQDENKELRTQLTAAQEEIQKLRQDLLTSYGESEELSGQLAKAEQRYLAWKGGEEWEQLAFQLCADECGEESCYELIWEGCPPEPWGDRWLKYESEAKRIIQLVRQYAPDKKAEQRVAEACALYIHSTKGAVGSINMAEAVLSGEWRKFVKEV